MKTFMLAAAMVATLGTAPVAMAPAFAQDWHHGGDHGGGDHWGGDHGGGDRGWHGDDHNWNPQDNYRGGGHYRDRRMGRDDQIFHGRDGRYYCRRSDGTTGLVIGALGGAGAGALLGGGTLGTLLGAGGGALLGRSIDRGNVHCR